MATLRSLYLEGLLLLPFLRDHAEISPVGMGAVIGQSHLQRGQC